MKKNQPKKRKAKKKSKPRDPDNPTLPDKKWVDDKRLRHSTLSPKKRGRKTKYNPQLNVQVEYCAEKGFTDVETGKLLGVSERTVNTWKEKFPEFLQSLKRGREIADQKVVKSLYQRATGYSHPDIHITNYQGDVTITPIIKHYAPDPTSIIFWLKNRRPKEWRDETKKLFGLDDETHKALKSVMDTIDGSSKGLPKKSEIPDAEKAQ